MIYKSQQKESLEEFKDYLKDGVDVEEARYAWNYFNKHLYIDDLNTYLRLKLNKAVEVSYGDYNADIAFVLKSMGDSRHVEFFKTMFSKLNMDFNDIYFTSYSKHTVLYKEAYDEVIALELKAIKPKIVYSIGDYNIQANDFELVVIDRNNFDRMLDLSERTDLTEPETTELSELKKTLWSQIKSIIKYYSMG